MAVTLYQQGCEGGHAQGCTALGVMYTKGTGVPQDSAKAAALYRQGCKWGDSQGCAKLGWLTKTRHDE